jgi:hypothetical protein
MTDLKIGINVMQIVIFATGMGIAEGVNMQERYIE